MAYLINGLLWIFISTLFSVIYFFSGGYKTDPWVIPIMLIFMGIGILCLFIWRKRISKNKETDIHGMDTYGVVIALFSTGSYINDRPELEANVLTYIEAEGSTKVFKEIIGLAPAKYNIGEFVKLKHYENDINIIEKVDRDFIPNYILNELDAYLEKHPSEAQENKVLEAINYINSSLETVKEDFYELAEELFQDKKE